MATPVPSVGRQDAINYLQAVHDDILDFSAQTTAILSNHNNGLITEATASSQAYALETAAYAYSDQVLLASNSFASVSASCESARQWMGDAVFYSGLSAGYLGLVYEFWPNVSLTDSNAASDQSFESLDLAADHLSACITGN